MQGKWKSLVSQPQFPDATYIFIPPDLTLNQQLGEEPDFTQKGRRIGTYQISSVGQWDVR